MEETHSIKFKALMERVTGFTRDTISRIRTNKNVASRLPLIPILIIAAVAAGVVFAKSVNTFEIYEGKNKTVVYSISQKAETAIGKLGLFGDDYKITGQVKTAKKNRVTIEKTFPVRIISGDEVIKVKAIKSTVGEILDEAGITVDKYDMVNPGVAEVMSKKGTIDYVNIDYVSETKDEVIPFDTRTVFSSTLSSGDSYVTNGSDGLKTVSYQTKLVNGIATEKTVISEQVITKPTSGVKVVGTANGGRITTGVAVSTSSQTGCYSTLTPASPIPLDENGVPTNYTNHITVQATAYTYTGFRTSTGKNPQPGYVAVNPSYIPYGTRMYIISSDGAWIYGYAEAADTGGFTASRPTNIDLFLETVSQCYAFGRRNIEVYFLP
ncbi:MAG: G5 domain-containing protein [Clostridia bacterium]|nr:G5 domain-containing protein [Clostridia bacterium]